MNTKAHNTISLFGGEYESAVIDSEGVILYIHESLLERIFLPDHEKKNPVYLVAINLSFQQFFVTFKTILAKHFFVMKLIIICVIKKKLIEIVTNGAVS